VILSEIIGIRDDCGLLLYSHISSVQNKLDLFHFSRTFQSSLTKSNDEVLWEKSVI
jgi:hypothetical protein